MPKRSTTKITQNFAKQLNPDPNRDYAIYDAELPGFGVRVRSTGTKTFILKYRNDEGRQRFLTLGSYGPMTVQQARLAAIKALAEVASNVDPLTERTKAAAPNTVAHLCDQYLAGSEAGRIRFRRKVKSAASLENDRSIIERHIKPLLGTRPIAHLKRQEVEDFMVAVMNGRTAANIKTKPRGVARVKGGPGIARKSVKLLSTLYNYALREELVTANPCVGVQTPEQQPKTRWLSEPEYAALGEALLQAAQEGVNPIALAAIRTLALTGCRRSEILNLKREELDVRGQCLRFQHTKTGAQIRPCGQPAIALLSEIAKSHHSLWIFPGSNTDGPLVNIRKPLERVCQLAKLEDVTAHVFRHSYATVAHELGYSELTIAGLLGHSAGSVTSRYAHHVDHALQRAADHVAGTIAPRIGMPVADQQLLVLDSSLIT